MATYLIFTRLRTTDPQALAEYGPKARASLAGQPVTPHVSYGAHEVLEGELHEGMVVLSCPDRDAALGWYNGSAYVEAREHRLRGADYQVTLVEGL